MSIGAVAVGFVVLSGCGGGAGLVGAGGVALPEEGCWGAFEPADLARVVGDGDEGTLNVSGGFVLARENQIATCRVEVDGEGRFLAEAKRPPVDGSVQLSTAAQDGDVEAEPLAFGTRGRVWSDGAVVGFTCLRRPEDPFEVELKISGRPAADDQRVLGRLMRQYFDAARQQLRCEA
ncbi:hypothetical protein ACIQWR_04575 [Streptomyces sp. NPDC098789]|uniref:hypothetical protein n=1 Tax=Streptomyces sp. NPDC098789 TaxID=3366098 RepID=UPI003807D2EA